MTGDSLTARRPPDGARRDDRSWLAKLLGPQFSGGPPITDVAMIPERRKAIDLASINTDLPSLAACHEAVTLRERDGTTLAAEIYVPHGAGPFPTLMWIHGGAWCVWSAAAVRRTATQIAAQGHLVVSLDYGLAPERPFPWAVEDAIYGARWAAVNAPAYNGIAGAVAIGGDSAGATLSCGAIAFLLGLEGETAIDEGDLAGVEVEFTAALLAYGVYDFAARMRERDTTPGTTEIMLNLAYLGTHFLAKHRDPLVSPILAANLAEFPPVYLNCGIEDALLPQSLAMTAAFAQAGVPATLSVLDGVDHEFLQLDPSLPVVAEEWERIHRWLARQTSAGEHE
jgi:acetyl esterase